MTDLDDLDDGEEEQFCPECDAPLTEEGDGSFSCDCCARNWEAHALT